jgi:hypothetical protein
MFYYAAPQTAMGLYAVGRPPDRKVVVLFTEEPETLEFLTFPRRDRVLLERDPSRLNLENLRTSAAPVEFVIEDNRRLSEWIRSLAENFPAARMDTLSDPRHRQEGRIAYVLSVDPGSSRSISDPAPFAGNEPSGGPNQVQRP